MRICNVAPLQKGPESDIPVAPPWNAALPRPASFADYHGFWGANIFVPFVSFVVENQGILPRRTRRARRRIDLKKYRLVRFARLQFCALAERTRVGYPGSAAFHGGAGPRTFGLHNWRRTVHSAAVEGGATETSEFCRLSRIWGTNIFVLFVCFVVENQGILPRRTRRARRRTYLKKYRPVRFARLQLCALAERTRVGYPGSAAFHGGAGPRTFGLHNWRRTVHSAAVEGGATETSEFCRLSRIWGTNIFVLFVSFVVENQGILPRRTRRARRRTYLKKYRPVRFARLQRCALAERTRVGYPGSAAFHGGAGPLAFGLHNWRRIVRRAAVERGATFPFSAAKSMTLDNNFSIPSRSLGPSR